jgi:hypothetical protein
MPQRHGKTSPPPHPPQHHSSALSHQYSVPSFAALLVLSCLFSPDTAVCVAKLRNFAVTLKHAVWWRLIQSEHVKAFGHDKESVSLSAS